MSLRPDCFGNTPEHAVANFTGALLPHPEPAQPTPTTPSTRKKPFNTHTHTHRLAQFNEFYRKCPRPPLRCFHTYALVGTPDRMLFIIGNFRFGPRRWHSSD